MTNGFTPLTPVSGFTADQLFQDDLGSLLRQLEGPVALPYVDSKGIVTVGIGVNLRILQNAATYFTVLNITDPNEKAALSNLFDKTDYPPGDAQCSELKRSALQFVGKACMGFG